MSDTLQENIYHRLRADAALRDLIGDRLYYDAPRSNKSAFPYVAFFEVSLVTDHNLQGTSGLRENRIQFDCYGSTRIQAREIRERLLALFDGYRGPLMSGAVNILCAVLSNQRSDFDHNEKIYSYGIDITFHYTIT